HGLARSKEPELREAIKQFKFLFREMIACDEVCDLRAVCKAQACAVNQFNRPDAATTSNKRFEELLNIEPKCRHGPKPCHNDTTGGRHAGRTPDAVKVRTHSMACRTLRRTIASSLGISTPNSSSSSATSASASSEVIPISSKVEFGVSCSIGVCVVSA